MEILRRDPNIAPADLKLALDCLSLGEEPHIVGSAAYVSHKYPSDVDVFESYFIPLPRKQAIPFLADRIRTIMRNYMIASDKLIFLDFKIGEERGEALHWTPQEILEQGQKNGVTLEKALATEAVLKLDVLVWTNGRYQSVEFFYLVEDNHGPYRHLPAYLTSISQDIEKYTRDYNPLKLLKRLWLLARVKKCWDLLEKLDPILSSNAAALNQVSNDIDVLLEILNQVRNRRVFSDSQIRFWFLQAQNLQKRIANHSYLNVTSFSDQVYASFLHWYLTKQFNVGLETGLIQLKDSLQPLINQEADTFLEALRQQNISCKME
ncbi:MAG: hypothetical protein ACYCQJ_14995 [Nitrososphaerales archaeon]